MRTSPRRDGQRGVILMVCLAMLTLFQIVGLTFVNYARSKVESDNSWRDAAWMLAEHAKCAAPVVRADLVDVRRGDLDFGESYREIDGLESEALAFQDRVAKAIEVEEDPEALKDLQGLEDRLTTIVDKLDRLRSLLRAIALDPDERPK